MSSPGEIDPIEVLKTILPNEEEAYYIGICILCIIVPILVSLYHVISQVQPIVTKNPAYDVANFQFFIQNTYFLLFGAMACVLINLLYALRKRPNKADSKNIGFWFTLSTLLLFFLLGARLSLLISMISVTGSDSIIYLNPSEVVYVQTKLSFLTLGIIICFLLSVIAFFLINGVQMIELFLKFKELANAVKESSSGGD
jgi:hypothetical protein